MIGQLDEVVGEELPVLKASRVQRSPSIAALADALAKAQGEIEGAEKGKVNPHYKSKYADLASVWDACREPLSKNGLAVLQSTAADGPTVTVTTILMHSSGEWMEGDLSMTAQQNTPQGIGSCITYARRYALSAMVGVAPEDDDGNMASQPDKRQGRKPASEPPPPLVVDADTERQEAPDGYLYVERITQSTTKGGKRYADIAFSNGEIALAFREQLIGLLEQIAQEKVPCAITTSQTSKGYTQIDTVERWKPEQPEEPKQTELEGAPF